MLRPNGSSWKASVRSGRICGTGLGFDSTAKHAKRTLAVIARSEATRQSSAREARQTKQAAVAAISVFFSAPAGARLDCFASLAMTVGMRYAHAFCIQLSNSPAHLRSPD